MRLSHVPLLLALSLAAAPLAGHAATFRPDTPMTDSLNVSHDAVVDAGPTAETAGAVAAAPAFERAVLDVEVLPYAKHGHARCQGRGFVRRIKIEPGIQLHRAESGDVSLVDMKPTGKKPREPVTEHTFCNCAVTRLQRANVGRIAVVDRKLYWRLGHAPALPAVTRSPFAQG